MILLGCSKWQQHAEHLKGVVWFGAVKNETGLKVIDRWVRVERLRAMLKSFLN